MADRITKGEIVYIGGDGLSIEIANPQGNNITWGIRSSTCTSNTDGSFDVLGGPIGERDTRKLTPAATRLIQEKQINL